MRRVSRTTHMLTIIIAGSYLTLILSSLKDARHLMIPYGVLILVLAFVNLIGEYNART